MASRWRTTRNGSAAADQNGDDDDDDEMSDEAWEAAARRATGGRQRRFTEPDIVAINVDATREVIARLVLEEGYSRMPVYRGTIDNIIGNPCPSVFWSHNTPRPFNANQLGSSSCCSNGAATAGVVMTPPPVTGQGPAECSP